MVLMETVGVGEKAFSLEIIIFFSCCAVNSVIKKFPNTWCIVYLYLFLVLWATNMSGQKERISKYEMRIYKILNILYFGSTLAKKKEQQHMHSCTTETTLRLPMFRMSRSSPWWRLLYETAICIFERWGKICEY